MPRLTLPRVLLIIASLGTAVVPQVQFCAPRASGSHPDLLLVVVPLSPRRRTSGWCSNRSPGVC